MDSTPHHNSGSVKAVPFHECYAKLLANRTKLRQKQYGEVKTKTLQPTNPEQTTQEQTLPEQTTLAQETTKATTPELQPTQAEHTTREQKDLRQTTPEATTPVLIGADSTPDNSNGSVKTVPFKEFYAKLLANRTKLRQEQYGEVNTKTWQLTKPIQTTPEKKTLQRITPEQATPGLSTPDFDVNFW